MKKNYLLIGALVPALAMAEQSTTTDELVVTASRLPESKSTALVNVDVVTAKDIKIRNIKTLTEVLNILPSVQVSIYGSRGQASSFSVRGGNGNQVLVLLDGNPINSSGIDAINPNQIPANIIEKVEYLRGHKATVYGANAISGVINIITKAEYKNKQQISYSYSSHASNDLDTTNVITLGDSTFVKLAGGVSSSTGYNVHPVAGLNDGEKHGYKNHDVQVMLAHTFDNDIELFGSYIYTYNKGEYDNSWGSNAEKDYNEVEKNIFTLGSNYSSDFYSYDLGAIYSKGNDYNYPKGGDKFGYSASLFNVKAFNVHFTNEFTPISLFSVGFGLDYDHNTLDSDSNSYGSKFANSDTSIINRAGYIFGKLNHDVLLAELSGRVDDNSVFNHKWTYSAGLGVKVQEYMVAAVRAGTAFRAPTLQELYYPYYGNLQLQPEKSKNYELSVSGKFDALSYNVSGFWQDFDNMIGSDPMTWQYINVNQARIKGLELGLGYSFGEYLTAKANATFLDPVDRTNHTTLRNKAKQSYKVSLNGAYADVDYFADYSYTSKRDMGGKYLSSYSLLNLGAGYTVLDNKVRFGVSVNNVFDKEFNYYDGYPTAGRTYMGTITIQNLF